VIFSFQMCFLLLSACCFSVDNGVLRSQCLGCSNRYSCGWWSLL
jgi:hypothetical protein